MKKIVDIKEANTNFSALLEEMMEGDEIIISKDNEPIAELKKIDKPKKRELGTLKGKLIVHGDFSDADEEIEKMFNQSKLFPDADVTD